MDNPEAREQVPLHSKELQPSLVLRYMVTDIFVQRKPLAPCNILAIETEFWGEMSPQRLAPDVIMMLMEAKVTPKVFGATSRYHPMATI